MAKLFTASDENISLLSQELLKGEIVGVPTETVYGLAAHAFNPSACARVFEAKRRPTFDPLIVHLPTDFDLTEVAVLNPLVGPLIEAFWPGPLTLVLKKKPIIPDIVTAGFNTVAIRMPRHPAFQKLLAACQSPLAAPSANPFGYVSPTTAEHVQSSLGDRIPYILDGGPCEIGLESTIIDIRNPKTPRLLRPGAVPAKEIERILSIPVTALSNADGNGGLMPGQLKKHYSPHSTCHLRPRIDPNEVKHSPHTAYLFFARPQLSEPLPTNLFWLSEEGSDIEAARNLFEILRHIDEKRFSSLIAEKAPNVGLGLAINDRLHRAAATDWESDKT